MELYCADPRNAIFAKITQEQAAPYIAERNRRMGGVLPQQDDIVAKVKRPSSDSKSAAMRPEVHA